LSWVRYCSRSGSRRSCTSCRDRGAKRTPAAAPWPRSGTALVRGPRSDRRARHGGSGPSDGGGGRARRSLRPRSCTLRSRASTSASVLLPLTVGVRTGRFWLRPKRQEPETMKKQLSAVSLLLLSFTARQAAPENMKTEECHIKLPGSPSLARSTRPPLMRRSRMEGSLSRVKRGATISATRMGSYPITRRHCC